MCRWMSEGKKLLQKLPGWMRAICFFSVPFSAFWAKWELNLGEVKGVLKPRHTQERGDCSALILELEMSSFVPRNPPGAAAWVGVGVSVCVIPVEEGREGSPCSDAVGKGLKGTAEILCTLQSLLFIPDLLLLGFWGVLL